jgi:hypothetical protein
MSEIGCTAAGERTAKYWPTGMNTRSSFKGGTAYDDLREWLVVAGGLGEVRTTSSTPASLIIGATNFRPAMHRAQKSPAMRRALRRAHQSAEMVPLCRD